MNGDLGAINFINMIPVKKANYKLINLDKSVKSDEEKKYYKLLREQLDWLNENYIQVCSKAYKLYDKYVKDNLSINIANRCCNFKMLEEKCIEYNSK